jgi:hypothetical protein
VKFNVLGRVAQSDMDWRRDPQLLGERVENQLAVRKHGFELIRMQDQQAEHAGDRAVRRLTAGHDDEAEERADLVVG